MGKHNIKPISELYQKFLNEKYPVLGSYRTAKSYCDIGNVDYTECTVEQVEDVILSIKPKTQKDITTIMVIFRSFAQYIHNDKLYTILNNIDRNILWEKAKENVPQQLINYADYLEAYTSIGLYEEQNAFYKQTLFRAIYEGIFSKDMSVLINLRGSDVSNGKVLLHNGETEYTIPISYELGDDLINLAQQKTLTRKNIRGNFEIPAVGLYHDSCFKIELRGGRKPEYNRNSYYNMLKKLLNEYAYGINPTRLFLSGMLHRVSLELKKENITVQEAFKKENRNRTVGQIIENQLETYHYHTTVRSFRETVYSNLDIFYAEE